MALEQATCDATGNPLADSPRHLAELDAKPASRLGSKPDASESRGSELSELERVTWTERLIADHQETVYRYAYRLTGTSSAAEDVCQEVFLRAFRSLHQLRDDAAARGWLLVIARNEFARWVKKLPKAIDVDSLSELEEADQEATAVDRSEWVQSALQQLPIEFRLVILMFYFEDLTYAQIAEQLDVPIGTVMSRLSRGKTHLKLALDELAESKSKQGLRE
jgi:RNA polymerase sigma-70 factor (ECF subfamily)